MCKVNGEGNGEGAELRTQKGEGFSFEKYVGPLKRAPVKQALSKQESFR